jgi:NADH dehydrogenase
MAKNIVATLRGDEPKEYFHKNAGAVAGIGLGEGVFQAGKVSIKGLIAWFMHRGYHGLAIPMWERKIRVFVNWFLNFLLRRDIVSLEARVYPRAAFEEFAARPKAAAAPKKAAPAKQKVPAAK